MVQLTWLLCGSVVGMVSFSKDWTDDYARALSAAREAQRPLVVVLEDPRDPELRSHVLATAKRELMQQFEVCRVDATSDYGKKVSELYGATQLPYTVITDATCRRILFRGSGQITPEAWDTTLATYAVGPNPAVEGEAEEANSGAGALEPLQESDLLPETAFSHVDFSSAREACQRRNRPMLVFVSMNNCHYCNKMQSETFGDRRLRRAIARRFESVIVKRRDHSEWVARQGVRIYPTTLILGPRGQLVDRIEGFVTTDELQTRIGQVSNKVVSHR